MPQIDDKCKFNIKPRKLKYTTVLDGDVLLMSEANIDAINSASLSWLINIPGDLSVEIKKKEGDQLPSEPTGGYIDRGDPATPDFSKTDFLTDEAWHVLDLSSIVPAGATLVHLRVFALTAYNDKTIVFCKNGIVNKINGATIRIPHGNKEYFKDVFVACDANRKIEYWTSNVVWINLDVLVRGWIK